MIAVQNRRCFMAGATAIGIAGMLGTTAKVSAEVALETTAVRLPRWINGAYCWAGAYLAGELLRADGFTDVRYVQGDPKLDQWQWIANGDTDFSINYVPVQLTSIESQECLSRYLLGCMRVAWNWSPTTASRTSRTCAAGG